MYGKPIGKLDKMFRKDLQADTMYFDQTARMYFYTPDGVGGNWYETEGEMCDAHGSEYVVHTTREIEDY